MSVGWYVHHHGTGHLHRFLAVRDRLGDDVVGLGSLPRPEGVPDDGWIELPSDVPDGAPDDPTAGGVLHWAPRRVDGLRHRTAAIAAWAARTDPDCLVVDVSCEVALLGRLLSIPTVVVAQRGVRTDDAHRAAWGGASVVLAPWTATTHAPEDGPPGARVVPCGAVSRFDELVAGDGPPALPVGADAPRRVLLLVGSGGHELRAEDVLAVVRATPGTTWDVAGALRVLGGATVVDHGPHADVAALVRAADVVVGTAGGNVVAEVAAFRRPLVLLPQDRPFEEQHRQAELLHDAGLATALWAWPPAADWPGVLRDAVARGGAGWAAHHDGLGAARIAAAVRAVAEDRDPVAAVADVGRPAEGARPVATCPGDGPLRCA